MDISSTSSHSSLYYTLADDILPALTDKCIILDIDHTLVCSHDDKKILEDFGIFTDPNLYYIRDRFYFLSFSERKKVSFWGITRPFLKEFLVFCFSYFKIVSIWSAGKKDYVHSIVRHIFKDLPQPHVVFTYDDVEFTLDGKILKPIIKMAQSNPVLEYHMRLDNTFCVDDNPMTFLLNKDNGILIPPYNPPLNIKAISRDDPSLIQLKYWLLQPTVMNSTDVRELDKTEIFTIPVEEYKKKLKLRI
ncbi:MAG: HAD family hydrolase [Nitrososphaerota archaeon]